ncbi:MAG: DUF1800 family protein [Acidiferrobacterales bacterium]|nr:DUF1800 family protein [Acidiferrobacterales bacterium]
MSASLRVRYCMARFVLIAFFAISSSAIAQSTDSEQPNRETMAAVNVITGLLMGGSFGPLSLGIESQSSARYGFQYGDGLNEEGLTIYFNGSTEDLRLCADTVDIGTGEVRLELNGGFIGNLGGGVFCITLPTGNGNGNQSTGENTLELVHTAPGDRWGITNISLRFTEEFGLPRLSRSDWDEDKVRKILKVFAFGGHARDSQITAWSRMDPSAAIEQMLNFSEHNFQLSPPAPGEKYSDPASLPGTLSAFASYLGSNSSNLPMNLDQGENTYNRGRFGLDGYDKEGLFFRMATTRGLNPFRQKIGMWETNYHLAVNLDTQVDNRQLVRYYDEIMEAHESGIPYQDVMAVASKSAAIAMQYGHRRNQWVLRNGEYICECNDDFAREIHQLFFGILGELDPESTASYNHHEEVTIPQTARMLTDMRVEYDSNIERFPDYVTFGTSRHHTGSLDILNHQITGANASQKIDNLVDISIENPESLAALPIIIISGLADDNLLLDNSTAASKRAAIRAAWAEMGSNKNFLEFVQAYAVSDLFHSPNQRKFATTIERVIYQANRYYLTNTESLQDRMELDSQLRDENVRIFRPVHNVFGGQTALEAANSPTIFESNYNRATEGEYFHRYRGTYCDDCDFGQSWEKDWGQVIPKTNGQYLVGDVAAWLWQYVVGNMDNYSTLEEAHLVSILGAAERKSSPTHQYHQNLYFDFNHLMCIRQEIVDAETNPDVSLDRLLRDYNGGGWNRFCRPEGDPSTYSVQEIELLTRTYSKFDIENTDYIQDLINELKQSEIPLDASPSFNQRRYANIRVQAAIAFILGTPYVFVEEQL